MFCADNTNKHNTPDESYLVCLVAWESAFKTKSFVNDLTNVTITEGLAVVFQVKPAPAMAISESHIRS
jgi:hypothetical protein